MCNYIWRVSSCVADIDECDEGTSGCEQQCTNAKGSFGCSCFDGYKLNTDNKTCIIGKSSGFGNIN